MNKVKVKEAVAVDKKLLQNEHKLKEVTQKYRAVLGDNAKMERELNAVLEIRRKGPKVFPITPTKRIKSESTAVIVASDWHLEEEVKFSSTNGLNAFNLEIFDRRADMFFKHALFLIELAKRETTLRHIVLALLGDFISGAIHEELLETCLLLPAYAIIKAQDTLASGIQFLLDNTDCTLTIPCTPGNHSRMTKKQRHATEQGNSLETYMYHNLARHFKGEKRVRFIIAEAYHVYLDVYGFTIRFHHGHDIKYQGGVGGLSIPLNKAIGQWNKGKWADLDVLGHWHQFKDFGNAIVNGSLIGHNAYAIAIKADYEIPRQAFFLIEKEWHKTDVRPIFVEKHP